jgi:hypothetical protein
VLNCLYVLTLPVADWPMKFSHLACADWSKVFTLLVLNSLYVLTLPVSDWPITHLACADWSKVFTLLVLYID